MMRRPLTPLLYIGALLLVLLIAAVTANEAEPVQEEALPPRPTLISLPTDYRETFVLYAAVDRVDNVTRRLYIEPGALAQWMRGEPLPDGTQLVIEVYDVRLGLNGLPLLDAERQMIPTQISGNIHVAEKRSTWELQDLATSARVGDWNFASFDPVTFQSTSENVNDCFTCHDTAHRRDFVFSRPLLSAYVESGEIQHRYCDLPLRAAC